MGYNQLHPISGEFSVTESNRHSAIQRHKALFVDSTTSNKVISFIFNHDFAVCAFNSPDGIRTHDLKLLPTELQGKPPKRRNQMVYLLYHTFTGTKCIEFISV